MYNSRSIGNYNENIAIEFLVKKKFKILEKNYRIKTGEIDIIAFDNDYLVFVEVKYRSNLHRGYPEEAVTITKQKRICKTATYYIKNKGLSFDIPIRFDVLAISDREIHHIENAFDFIY